MQRSCRNVCNSFSVQWYFCAVWLSFVLIVGIRVICNDRPTHDQQKQAGKNIHWCSAWILTIGVSSKHRSDEGGNPKVETSQRTSRDLPEIVAKTEKAISSIFTARLRKSLREESRSLHSDLIDLYFHHSKFPYRKPMQQRPFIFFFDIAHPYFS